MRQKQVIWVVALVVLVVIALIAVFAIVRQDGHMDDDDVNAGHQHNDMQHSDTQENMAEQNHHENEGSDRHQDSSNMELSGVLKDGQRVVKIKARRFEFEPNRIVVKKGEKVRLEVTSEDVTHGINIEAFDINRELKPNKTEIIDFTANQAGPFHFHCSVYCGKGHSDMHGELIVLE